MIQYLLRRLTIIAILLAGAHLTRFENTIRLSYSPGLLTAWFHETEVQAPGTFLPPDSIDIVLQRSMVAQTKLTGLEITQSSSDTITKNYPCLYLFGRCIAGNAVSGSFPSFTFSFGDWTQDRTRSERLPLITSPLQSSFEATFSFAGRGDQSIHINLPSGERIELNLSDGFIDNAYSLCIAGDCRLNGYNQEELSLNVRRIVNFFFEAFLIGYLLALALKILSIAVPAPQKDPPEPVPGRIHKIVLCSAIIVHFLAAAYFSRNILGSIPHISDSAIYYRQAVLLSHGMLQKTDPVPGEPGEAFLSNSSKLIDGRIEYFHANHFWPAMLSAAMLLNITDLLGPLLSALSVWLVYLIGAAIYDRRTGLTAAVIYSACPFTIIMAGDYMMHTSTAALFLGFLACALYGLKNDSKTLLLGAGLCLGYAFAIRQLTVAALLPPCLLLIAFRKHRPSVSGAASFVAGFGAVAALMVLDHHVITGEWFTSVHTKIHNLTVSWRHMTAGTDSVDAILGYLPPILFGSVFPQLSLAFIILPLITAFRLSDWLLFLCFLFVVLAHTCLPVSGLHGYGPRFLLETFFALSLLAARSFSAARLSFGKPAYAALSAAGLLLLAQNYYFQNRFFRFYRSYNGVTTDAVDKIKARTSVPAIFVVKGAMWQDMDSVVKFFDPTFKKRIFIREMEDGSHLNIIKKFPEWPVYELEGSSLKPWASVQTERENHS